MRLEFFGGTHRACTCFEGVEYNGVAYAVDATQKYQSAFNVSISARSAETGFAAHNRERVRAAVRSYLFEDVSLFFVVLLDFLWSQKLQPPSINEEAIGQKVNFEFLGVIWMLTWNIFFNCWVILQSQVQHSTVICNHESAHRSVSGSWPLIHFPFSSQSLHSISKLPPHHDLISNCRAPRLPREGNQFSCNCRTSVAIWEPAWWWNLTCEILFRSQKFPTLSWHMSRISRICLTPVTSSVHESWINFSSTFLPPDKLF